MRSSTPPTAWSWSITRREVVIALGLALLAAIPRLVTPLALDPFVDEVVWVHWAVDRFRWSDPGTFWLPVVADGRPPLHLWLLLLTRNLSGNAFVDGRLAVALPSIASAVGLYALGRVLVGDRVGVVAGLLWAVSPFSVFFGRLASSDDVLLTLLAMLVALTAVLLVRRPSPVIGALCGLCIGLAVMAKTLGVLTAATPVLAVLTLAGRSEFRRLLGPLIVAGLVASLVLLPLVPWVTRLQQTVAFHTDAAALPPADATMLGLGGSWLDQFGRRQPLVANIVQAFEWLRAYLGLPMLLLAGLALLLIPLRRRRALLFLALVWVFGAAVLLDRTTVLFSRYLLSSSFPLYLLAASALVWLADAGGAALSATVRPPASWPIRPALLVAGVSIVLTPMLPFTAGLISAPDQAPLPAADRFQYVDQWYALHGLARVVDFLREEARDGPVSVLVPPLSSEMSMLVPYGALRLYLRGDPGVSFVETPEIRRAESFRQLRLLGRGDRPLYLVTNGTHVPNAGSAVDAPAYTRKVEAALARDLPRARLVLHIPRPAGPSWLSVYRIGRQPATVSEPGG